MSKLGTGLSLAKLAEHKKLPSEFLARLGVNDHLGGVAIRYYDDAGDEIVIKRRTDVVARNGSYWPGGTKLAAYGLWKIHEARKVGFVILVEGESDCWALWHHGLPALGLPGSGTAQTLTAEALERHRDPLRPSRAGPGRRAVCRQRRGPARQLHFAGRAFEIQMPDRLKDPADLHKDNPERFKERMETVILKSKPLLLGNTNRKPAEPRVEEPPAAEVIRLSKVAPDKTHWLWQYRIPRGALTVLEGDPGLGKSTLTAELAGASPAASPSVRAVRRASRPVSCSSTPRTRRAAPFCRGWPPPVPTLTASSSWTRSAKTAFPGRSACPATLT